MRFELISIVQRVYDDIPTHRIERLKGQEKRQVGKPNIDFNFSRRMRFFYEHLYTLSYTTNK